MVASKHLFPKDEYYRRVPKGIRENLAFRRWIIERGSKDKGLARELWIACKREPLFYFNVFGWAFDPRASKFGTPKVSPFITYPFQDRAFAEIFEVMAVGEDLLIEKSRDMGASWMCLMAFEHQWHFYDFRSFLMVSRKEELVDKKGDPKSLFWKLDFILKNQPSWIVPRFSRKKLHLENQENGSTIDGESTTGDVARGDRRTTILMDEFAMVENGHAVLSATADATSCRIFNSTPKGTGNAFYDMRQTGIRRIRMHWSEHPLKNIGMYTDSAGKIRSPWYDYECKRRANPQEVAQEIDIDYLGSDYQFFDQDELNVVKARDVRDPYRQGELEYDQDSLEPIRFVEKERGQLLLWVHVGPDGRPVGGKGYSVGADVSTGTGASNSSICVLDRTTGEKVAEFTDANILPHKLGKLAVALCRWFSGSDRRGGGPESEGAFLIWEANGPGRIFGRMVVESGYRNFYFRKNEKKVSDRFSNVPGWYNTTDAGADLLAEYRRALSAGDFIQRSYSSVEDCRLYVFKPSGQVMHVRASTTTDPSGARTNHADRVIADALAWKGARENRLHEESVDVIPVGSFLHRRLQREAESRRESEMVGW